MKHNLSAWAIGHRSLIAYFMLVLAIAGAWSYLRLGRGEDPDFTIKTMVVQATWPGATIDDTLQQITDWRPQESSLQASTVPLAGQFGAPGYAAIFVSTDVVPHTVKVA